MEGFASSALPSAMGGAVPAAGCDLVATSRLAARRYLEPGALDVCAMVRLFTTPAGGMGYAPRDAADFAALPACRPLNDCRRRHYHRTTWERGE